MNNRSMNYKYSVGKEVEVLSGEYKGGKGTIVSVDYEPSKNPKISIRLKNGNIITVSLVDC